MSDKPISLNDFHGRARLFPLPDLVLFPYAAQALHVFEPRYRQLMDDALQDDRLIGMALLQPGWEEYYHKRPPIHPIICLCRIHREERLPDGRWNLLLQGVARARVETELKTERLYRIARVHLVQEEAVALPQTAGQLRRQLVEVAGLWFGGQAAALAQLNKLLHSELSLGALCDIFGFNLPIAVEVKQQLLEDAEVEQRARRLVAHLEANAPPKAAKASPHRFPPEFSPN
jgi:uncharacterized protein